MPSVSNIKLHAAVAAVLMFVVGNACAQESVRPKSRRWPAPSLSRLPRVSEPAPRIAKEHSSPSLAMPAEDVLPTVLETAEEIPTPIPQAAHTPTREPDNSPWWANLVGSPIRNMASDAIPVDIATLLSTTAEHSGRVQAIRLVPWISGTQVAQARAAFDPNIYMDNKYDSINDPVESTLITGGPPRLEDAIWGMTSGLRGQTTTGATYGISQRLGHKNSNSTFFQPNDQGTARLSANFTQPLLRGRRIDLNRSLVFTAQFDTETARAEYYDGLQGQLVEVAQTYWSLYVERATLLQRKQHLGRAEKIAAQLGEREAYDSVRSQILRAKAAVANRRADLAQSDANIKNLESRLRALINAPGLSDELTAELLPVDQPILESTIFEIESEVNIALQQRPEILELESKKSSADVRLQYAIDQTRAKLNLVAEGYVAGLEGESRVFDAVGSQFREGEPGFGAGFEFEVPYRRRAASALVRQRQLELAQLEHLCREATATIRAEVESAVRNVEASRQAVLGRHESLAAVQSEIAYLEDRWKSLAGDSRFGQLQLEDLLSGHVRLLQEEQSLLTALADYKRSLVEVQRATGSLIRFAN